MRRILIVEDEPDIRRFLRLALVREGCTVEKAGSLKAGLSLAGETRPELVILDLGLPDGDGLEFIRAWRGWSEAPLLVLSARSLEADKVAALDAGADDYLAKPFGVAELLARVRALLRRSGGAAADEPQVRFGRVWVDRALRQVFVDDAAIHLTPIEYRLLLCFLSHPGRVLTHRQLLRDVWGAGHGDSGHVLRVYVGRLRHLLECDPAQPRHLLTETGVGYRFQP